MFGYIASWSDDLSFADVVVFQKDDFEQVSDILVCIDNLADLVDEVNDGLGLNFSLAHADRYGIISTYHPVPRSSLSAKD